MDWKKRNWNWKKILTFVGTFILNSTTNITLYIGNLSVYFLSYFAANENFKNQFQGPWVYVSFTISKTFGMLITDMCVNRFGARPVLLVGSLVFSLGAGASYFTVQVSLACLTLSLGIGTGFGCGAIYGVTSRLLISWISKNFGAANAVIPMANSVGSIFVFQAITLFINPDNKTPDVTVGSATYFSQRDVLDTVPLAFMYFGLFTLALHVSTCFLMFENKNILCDLKTEFSLNVNGRENGDAKTVAPYGACAREDTPMTVMEHDTTIPDISPKQLLKTRDFYVLWCLNLVSYLSGSFFYSYYKLYGEVWIHDDFFLTNVGTVVLVIVLASRPVFGILFDKIGLKNMFIIYFSTTCVCYVFFYVTPIIHPWLYVLVASVLGANVSSQSILYVAAIVKCFGRKYFMTNLSLISTAPLVGAITLPFITNAMLTHFGWFPTFLLMSILLLMATIGSTLFLPKG